MRNGYFKKYLMAALTLIFALLLACMPATQAEASSARMSVSKKTLYVGREYQLKVKNYSKKLTWTTENEKIVTVDETGLVTAVKKGTAYVYATTAKGTTFKCRITVKNPYVNPKTATLEVGETLQLKVVGANPMAYKSAKSTYAKVSTTGLVTARKASADVIKIKVTCDNDHAYYCKLTIVPKAETKGTATLEEGCYGILNPTKKTEYKKVYTYPGTVSTDEQMIECFAEGLSNGAEQIEFQYTGDYLYWWNLLGRMTNEYSVLAGYANGMDGMFYPSQKKMIVTPTYKDGWKAVTLLKHTGYEADDTVKTILEKCTDIVNEAMAASDDTVEQLRYINGKICDMSEYDEAAEYVDNVISADGKVHRSHDATGVLMDGKGVCESYTCVFRICLEIMGIENHVVNDKSAAHVWNRVKLNDKWYHFDITWNDTCEEMFFMLDDTEFAEATKEVNNNQVYLHEWYPDYLP